MAEGEITVDNSPEQAPRKPILIKEVRAEVLEKEAQRKEIEDQQTRENIAKNAQNFWRFFNQISPRDYPQLKTPEKLIEALNRAEGNFVQEGGKFSLHGATHQVFEIHPPHVINDQEASKRILNLCKKEGYSLLSGTNFWDNPPEVGRLFIPAIYLVKKLE